MSLDAPLLAEKRRKLLYGGAVAALIVFIGLGVFAKNGWLPSTDPLTGKKTGWFGKALSEPGAVVTGFSCPYRSLPTIRAEQTLVYGQKHPKRSTHINSS